MTAALSLPRVRGRLTADAPLAPLVWFKSGGNAAKYRSFSLYDLIRHNLDDLFLDMRIVDVSLFRVTRGRGD